MVFSRHFSNFVNLIQFFIIKDFFSRLQEIVSIYPFLAPAQLSQPLSNRVCNVLGLLQCLALHSETRSYFISGFIYS